MNEKFLKNFLLKTYIVRFVVESAVDHVFDCCLVVFGGEGGGGLDVVEPDWVEAQLPGEKAVVG